MMNPNLQAPVPATNAPLSLDDQIRVAHISALSSTHNYKSNNLSAALLRCQKLSQLLSPNGRCSVAPGYSFWPWEPSETDNAPDLVEAARDGELDELEDLDEPTPTLRQLRSCDLAIFYVHILNIPTGPPSPNVSIPLYPVALVEVNKNPSPQLQGGARLAALDAKLAASKLELGEQVGYMFRNAQFNAQPYVIGIAMAEDAWAYATFHKSERPVDFDQPGGGRWALSAGSWSPMVVWGTPESNRHCDQVVAGMRQLLSDCGINRIY